MFMSLCTLRNATLIVLLAGVTLAANATDDTVAIKKTVIDYIEAYYTSDATRMESALHPHFLKHTISGSATQARISDRSAMDMIQHIRDGAVTPTPRSERVEKVTVLDVSGDIASVKLETAHWVDYLTLTKVGGGWKILSVVQREDH